MSVSLLRRVGCLSLLVLGLSACHHDSSPAPTASTQAPSAASPVPAAAAAASTAAVKPTPTPFHSASPDPAVAARENQVGQLINTKYPNLAIQTIAEVDAGGDHLYFVMASGQLLYTNGSVNWLFEGGHLIAGVGDQVHDVTADMGRRLAAGVYAHLPLDQAMTKVYGKGERQFVMFSDPDCPVCQAFEQALDKAGPALNAKVYTFAFPVLATHPDSLNKTAYLMCTSDPGESWHDWMVHADAGWDKWTPTHASQPGCDRLKLAAVGSLLAQKLHIVRTPTVMLPNGTITSGAPTIEQLNQALSLPTPPPLVLPVAPAPTPAQVAPSASTSLSP